MKFTGYGVKYEGVSIDGRLGVICIEYGFDDYVIWSWVSEPTKTHRTKIHYTNNDAYFMAGRVKYYLSEIVSTDSHWLN